MILRLVAVLLMLGTSHSYRYYQDRIPNGGVVPHPCKPNYIWWGLGHKNPLGGADRNPFGRDFGQFHEWIYELCMMDSDHDNMTNGEELGDPDCIWKPGQQPTYKNGISHPGVCDPWGSPECAEANKDVSCETGEFICDGLDSPDVFNITFRFPPTVVPAKGTTYICLTFELSDYLDANTDYHLIATQPYIDNPNVMHHTILSSCNAFSEALTEPEECNMASPSCQSQLGLWVLGLSGECINKEAGFKVGATAGVTRINMQHHWTNPELRTDYKDSSGMTLYFTTKLRPNNAAYFITGQNRIVIPPGEDRVVVQSTCTPYCSNHIMNGPIQLMTGLNHMHYLGIMGNVELFREGEKLHDLTLDEEYSYDSPVNHKYTPTIEMRPGDQLETTCVFKSTSRSATAVFGEGTYDEMCFGLFTYFPAENLKMSACATWGDLDTCDYNFTANTLHDCNFDMMFNPYDPTRNYLIKTILDNCNYYGECRRECPAAVAEVMKHPCLSVKMIAYITDMMRAYSSDDHEVTKFLAALQSCSCPALPTLIPIIYPSSASLIYVQPFLTLIVSVFTILFRNNMAL